MNARITPAINQIEIHPFFQQDKVLKNIKEFGVQPQACEPLSQGKRGLFTNETLSDIVRRHGKSIGHVIPGQHIQRGVAVIPKSTQQGRIEENLNIWDFTLSNDVTANIAKLECGIPSNDPAAHEVAKDMNTWEIHG